MEVKADLRPILGPTLVRLDPARVKQLQNMTVYKAIDALAKLSADSMQLRQPLTTCEKLINTEHTLYLSWEYDEEKKVSRFIGLLKVGRKKLFLYDNEMHTYEGRILCLLDFYVHYSVQRQGHGRKLFDFMLTNEHVQPFEVALDNPSVTLLGFVGRQYYLYNPIWQNTNFVVFPELFAALGPDEEFAREAPEGWRRPETPRRIGTGMTQTRYIAQAVSGHPSRGNATCSPVDADQSTEGTLANRAHQARVRKAHILSSKPLW